MKSSVFIFLLLMVFVFTLFCSAIRSGKEIDTTQSPAQSDRLWLLEDQQLSEIRFETQTLSHKIFEFTATIPCLHVQKKRVGQQVYTELKPFGGRVLGKNGRPGLPGFSRMVAVPSDAQVQITVTEGKPVTFENILLHPVQPVYDLEKGPESFKKEETFYQKDAFSPEELVTIGYDWIRGCKIARINIATARYNPARKTLVCYPEMDVKIDFIGGSETYISNKKRSRFFEELYGEILGNYRITQMDAADLIRVGGPLPWRCDLLIITPEEFKEHVLRLAAWKEEKGFITRVATLNDIKASLGGTRANDIRQYIQHIYRTTNLSYVLLVGDAEIISVHYRNIHPSHDSPLGTDLYYAEMDNEGFFPDLGLGRLSVDTEDQAEMVINKIIDYEKNPPSSRDFYNRILHISYFEDMWSRISPLMVSDGQDENYFVEAIEAIRDVFLLGGDYTYLPRQYATNKSLWPEEGTPEAEGFNGPERYHDGDPIPGELLYPGFAWDGSAEGIINEIEAGAFLMIYNGHGKCWGWNYPRFECGWLHPEYTEYPLSRLDNKNLTPVTLSFACRTGWFDQETDIDADSDRIFDEECFAEEFLRMNGGSVAVVASSRNSRGGLTEDMAKCFIDGIWDNLIYGYPNADWPPTEYDLSRRLGDVLNYSKFYLAEQYGHPDNAYQDYAICGVMFEGYHLFGDPTMELWVSNPRPVTDLPLHRKIIMCPVEPLGLRFEILMEIEGVVVTLMRKGSILGQGISRNGKAVIHLDKPLPNARGCDVFLAKQGYLAESRSVSISRFR